MDGGAFMSLRRLSASFPLWIGGLILTPPKLIVCDRLIGPLILAEIPVKR